MRGRDEMSEVVKENLKKLGHRAKDKVTGFEGVITCVTFDLYGCVQAILQPAVNSESPKIEDSRYFDVARLEIDPDSEPVMAVPGFVTDDKGPADKPATSMR